MKDSGYTLMELLVVLLLVSMITVTLSSGIHFGVRVWETVEQRGADARHVAIVQGILRQSLNAALFKADGAYADFDGDPDQVRYLAPAPRALHQTAPVRVLLALSDDKEGGTAIAVHFEDQGGATLATMQAHAASRLRLSYLDGASALPAWQMRWRDSRRLPDAVRIDVDDGAASADWPQFVARLAVGERANCRFDPTSQTCQD